MAFLEKKTDIQIDTERSYVFKAKHFSKLDEICKEILLSIKHSLTVSLKGDADKIVNGGSFVEDGS